jgi:hypothetical protein
MTVTINGTSGVTTPGVANTGNETITGNLAVTGAATAASLQVGGVTTNVYPVVSGTAVAYTSFTATTYNDFTGIPSWVKRVTILFNGLSSSGTSTFLIQIGDSGGIENTGYSCLGSTISSASAASSEYTAGFGIGSNASYAATSTYSGFIVLDWFDTNTWCVNGTLAGVGQTHSKIVSGAKALSAGPLTQVRVTTVNGTDTFDAGSINILYE